MRSKSTPWIALFALTAASVAMAAPVELHAVDFPERSTVTLDLAPEPGAPDAKMQAKVTYKDGQATIDLTYNAMKPAILYGEDITCYVAWAVTRDGNVYNLGELLASTPKGSRQFTTANKNFAILLTAEPIGLVREPSAYPTFKNQPVETRNLTSRSFRFNNFRDLTPRRAVSDIRGLAWDDKTPLELLQARKAYEIAGRLNAGTFAPSYYRQANEALQMANDAYEQKPKNKEVIDYARRSTNMAFEAVNVTWVREETLLIEAALEERRREMDMIAREIEMAKGQAEKAQRDAERATKQAQTMAKQRVQLSSLLRKSMSQVATTKETAQGVVLSLPDILFGVNQSTLKKDAEVVLAKLSGILLVMNDFKIRIEGYTDNTGSPDYNRTLSEKRAESVVAFMAGQGIDPQRMSSVGFGIEKPVADNTTEAGRKKNRRVEVVLSGA